MNLSSKTICKEFVDVHGRSLHVILDESGEIYIPLSEIRQSGFNIYKKSQYNKLLVTDQQFNDEFYKHVLNAATTFMLSNQIRFEQADVIKTIDDCRKSLINMEFSSPTRESSSSLINGFTSRNRFPKGDSFNLTSGSGSSAILQDSISAESSFTENKTSLEYQSLSTSHSNSDSGANEQSTEASPKDELKKPTFLPRRSGGSVSDKENKPNVDRIRRNKLDLLPTEPLDNGIHEVTITHKEVAKNAIAWVRDKKSEPVLEIIQEKIQNECKTQPWLKSNLQKNHIYLAEDQGEWFRCKIICFKPLVILFIDFGNVITTNEVKVASHDVASYPCLANRISFLRSNHAPKEGDEIRIKIIKKFDDGTYSVQIVAELNVSPKEKDKLTKELDFDSTNEKLSKEVVPEPDFFNMPVANSKIENNLRVLILNETKGSIFLRTQKDSELMAKISEKITSISLFPVNRPKVGQLVLCQRTDPKTKQLVYARGVIQSLTGDKMADVDFLDYFDTSLSSIDSLRRINQELAEMPLAYFRAPKLTGLAKTGFSDAMHQILKNKIEQKTKFQTCYTEKKYDLMEEQKSGLVSLTQQLNELNKPLLQPNRDDNRIMLSDISVFKPEIASAGYLCSYFLDLDTCYFVLSEALEDNIESIILQEVADSKPYFPITGEVCLGLYNEEWQRCAVSRVVDADFEVLFIDFGNKELLKADSLRKAGESVTKLPALALPCRFVELPDCADINKELKENVLADEMYVVDVKGFKNGKYDIVIPSVYNKIGK